MRLKYQFETMELEDQTIAVPVGEKANEFHGVVKLNETSAQLFQLLQSETTEEKVVDTMADMYNVSRTAITADVKKFIDELTEKGLLE